MKLPIIPDNHLSSVAYGPMGPPISLDRAKTLSGAIAAVFASSGMGKPDIGATCEDGGNSAVCGNNNFLVVVCSEDDEKESRLRVELHTNMQMLVGEMSGNNTKLMLLFLQLSNVVETIVEMCDAVDKGDTSSRIIAIPLDPSNKKVTKGRSIEEVFSELSNMQADESADKRGLN